MEQLVTFMGQLTIVVALTSISVLMASLVTFLIYAAIEEIRK